MVLASPQGGVRLIEIAAGIEFRAELEAAVREGFLAPGSSGLGMERAGIVTITLFLMSARIVTVTPLPMTATSGTALR